MLSFQCYCGSGKAFSLCCEPLIYGQSFAHTAEQLMRSRYSAYCHHAQDARCYHYILQTYHSSVRAQNSLADIADFAKAVRFIGLDIRSAPGLKDQTSTTNQVHFIATYLIGDKLELLDEVSEFEQEQGRWVYCNGKLTEHPAVKLSRNDACPCGSGLKFKKCQHPHKEH